MYAVTGGDFFSGQPPQVNGVFDQLEAGYVPSLRKDRPNMGSMMKQLGYRTAFYGKWEMDFDILSPKSNVNYSTALQPYGFDVYQPDGDKTGTPDQGYKTDVYPPPPKRPPGCGACAGTAQAAAVLHDRELRQSARHHVCERQRSGNAASAEGRRQQCAHRAAEEFAVRQALGHGSFADDQRSTVGPRNAPALTDYHVGWSRALGFIPADRSDMWRVFSDYYLNMIRDTDLGLAQLLDGLAELNFWNNTVVIFTADHGEMARDHGGLRGKGPFAYEGNAHLPLIIVHPDYPGGQSSPVLTSHFDLMPTLLGLAGVPEAQAREAVKRLLGRDFSGVLAHAETAAPQAVRPGVLFNYVAPLTIDFGLLPIGDDDNCRRDKSRRR